MCLVKSRDQTGETKMDENNSLVTSTQSNNFITPELVPLDRNPIAIFLASKIKITREDHQRDLNTIARILGADNAFVCNWAELRYQHTQAIRTKLQETVSQRTGKPYSPQYINHMLIALRGVLKTTWRLGLISGEDYRRAIDVEGVKEEKLPAGRELEKSEIMALFQDCEKDPTMAGVRDAAIIALAYSCGLRRTEIVNLNLDDYDRDTGRLIIHGKRSKQRTAYMVNGAKRAMADWLSIRGDNPGGLFVAIGRDQKILSYQNMSSQAVYDILTKRGRNSNVADLSPHDLRRTFVSDLLDAGADLATISRMAGHSSVVTTARYDRRPETSKIRAAEMLHVPYHGRNGK
jgi:integrase/recombinase XerD